MQRQKKRVILISIVSIIAVVLCVIYAQADKNQNPLDVRNPVVTYKAVEDNFYYEHLTMEEVAAYDKIAQQFDSYQGGFVAFDKAISHDEYCKIMQTVAYGGAHRYWNYAWAYPVDKDEHLMSSSMVYTDETCQEKNIVGIYLMLNQQEASPQLKNFQLELSEDNVIQNGEALAEVLAVSDLDEAYVNGVTEQIKALEQEIIEQMPEGLNQKEAVAYFNSWITNNMTYDFSAWELGQGMVTENLHHLMEIGDAAYAQCILDKTGVCSGFAIILSDLCNQIGIPSHVVVGTVSNGVETINHAWTAVEIGNETYYTDPTYSNTGKVSSGLAMKTEYEKGVHGLRYEFFDVSE